MKEKIFGIDSSSSPSRHRLRAKGLDIIAGTWKDETREGPMFRLCLIYSSEMATFAYQLWRSPWRQFSDFFISFGLVLQVYGHWVHTGVLVYLFAEIKFGKCLIQEERGWVIVMKIVSMKKSCLKTYDFWKYW